MSLFALVRRLSRSCCRCGCAPTAAAAAAAAASTNAPARARVPRYTTASELVRAVQRGEANAQFYGEPITLSESEVEAIAGAVGESGKVKVLDLSDAQITDVGASALAEAVARSASLAVL